MKLPPLIHSLPFPSFAQDGLETHREQIVFNILRVMSLLGLALLSVYAVRAVQERNWVILITFSTIYLLTLTITFLRRLPYPVRATGLLFVIYALGAITLLQDGLTGNGRIYLLAFSIIAGILLGVKLGVAAVSLSILTLGAAYTAFRTGAIMPPLSTSSDISNVSFWAVAFVSFATVAVTTTVSVVTLLRRLDQSIEAEKIFSTELQKERQHLEETVRQRTEDLQRRLVHMHTAAEITRSANTLLQPQKLLNKVVNLLQERFGLYYAGVFLLDENSEYAVLAAGTGEPGQKMIAAKHKLAVGGTSMIGWAAANKKARIALDVGQEAVHFHNPYLPHTRSELALPLIVGEQVLGALSVQSSRPEAFDQDDIMILQGMADGLATALQNAWLYDNAQSNLREIRSLHQQYLEKSWLEASLSDEELFFSYEAQPSTPSNSTRAVEVPITLRDHVIGRLWLEGVDGPLTAEEGAYIESLTTEAAAALENVRLLRETQRLAIREHTIAEIAGKVRSATTVDAVLQLTLQEIGRAMRASGGWIELQTSPYPNPGEAAADLGQEG